VLLRRASRRCAHAWRMPPRRCSRPFGRSWSHSWTDASMTTSQLSTSPSGPRRRACSRRRSACRTASRRSWPRTRTSARCQDATVLNAVSPVVAAAAAMFCVTMACEKGYTAEGRDNTSQKWRSCTTPNRGILVLQPRGRFKSDYYSDEDDKPSARPAQANGAAAARPPAKPTAKACGKAGAKKDPAAERRARLLAEESEVNV